MLTWFRNLCWGRRRQYRRHCSKLTSLHKLSKGEAYIFALVGYLAMADNALVAIHPSSPVHVGNYVRQIKSDLPIPASVRHEPVPVGELHHGNSLCSLVVRICLLYAQPPSNGKLRFVVTICTLLECLPPQKLWEPELDGTCYNYPLFFLGSEIADTVLDVVVLGLPVPAVLSLKMSAKQKFSLCSLFLLGGL